MEGRSSFGEGEIPFMPPNLNVPDVRDAEVRPLLGPASETPDQGSLPSSDFLVPSGGADVLLPMTYSEQLPDQLPVASSENDPSSGEPDPAVIPLSLPESLDVPSNAPAVRAGGDGPVKPPEAPPVYFDSGDEWSSVSLADIDVERYDSDVPPAPEARQAALEIFRNTADAVLGEKLPGDELLYGNHRVVLATGEPGYEVVVEHVDHLDGPRLLVNFLTLNAQGEVTAQSPAYEYHEERGEDGADQLVRVATHPMLYTTPPPSEGPEVMSETGQKEVDMFEQQVGFEGFRAVVGPDEAEYLANIVDIAYPQPVTAAELSKLVSNYAAEQFSDETLNHAAIEAFATLLRDVAPYGRVQLHDRGGEINIVGAYGHPPNITVTTYQKLGLLDLFQQQQVVEDLRAYGAVDIEEALTTWLAEAVVGSTISFRHRHGTVVIAQIRTTTTPRGSILSQKIDDELVATEETVHFLGRFLRRPRITEYPRDKRSQ